jgi:methylphosphotriester-DNA--protein-cysteine methyltransferase
MRIPLITILVLASLSLGAHAQFVGSKNSNKYHTTECRWAKNISAANLVTFKTAEDAAAADYVPCKVCSPAVASEKPKSVSPSKATTVAPTTPAQKSDGRCEATTKKGTRCSRKAQAGSRYCWQHQR